MKCYCQLFIYYHEYYLSAGQGSIQPILILNHSAKPHKLFLSECLRLSCPPHHQVPLSAQVQVLLPQQAPHVVPLGGVAPLVPRVPVPQGDLVPQCEGWMILVLVLVQNLWGSLTKPQGRTQG